MTVVSDRHRPVRYVRLTRVIMGSMHDHVRNHAYKDVRNHVDNHVYICVYDGDFVPIEPC